MGRFARFTVKMRDPRRIANNAVMALSVSTPIVFSNSVVSSFNPQPGVNSFNTWTTLSIPARAYTLRGQIIFEIVSNTAVTRLASQSIQFRGMLSDGTTFGASSVSFVAGVGQWFMTRVVFTDVTIGLSITSISMQMNAVNTTDSGTLTIRTNAELVPMVLKQPV